MSGTAHENAENQSKYDIPLRQSNHPDAYFPEELAGWHGYIEWEKYPDKKAKAAQILSQYTFADVRSSSMYTSKRS